MTLDDIKAAVVSAVSGVAPEIDAASIHPGVSFRDELDLDSMDFFNFMLALHERLGVEIPEVDYPKLYTFDGAVTYLVSKTGARAAPSS